MDWLFSILLMTYFIHAMIDAACAVVTLFYKPSASLSLIADEEQSQENTATASENSEKYKEVYFSIIKTLYMLYPSILNDISLRQEPEILKRIMIYWIASMSLIRLVAVYWPCTQTILCVSIMYLLEALVAEYEGFTFKSIISSQAKLVSVFSFGMSVISVLAIIFMSK